MHLPVPTPFTGSGDLDLSAWDDNLAHWSGYPIAGIVVAGSTGEAPLLRHDELFALVSSARERVADRVLIAGAGAESTAEAVYLGRELAARGADALLVRAPSYYRPAMTDAALEAHFLAVAEASEIPILLYHIPKFVPVSLSPDLVARLVEHPRIVGIKDSSGDMENLGRLVEACSSRAAVLVGSGSRLLEALERGALGGILGVAVVATAMACEVHAAYRRADVDLAREVQRRLTPLHDTVVATLGVAGVKRAMDELGLFGGDPRPPLPPLSPDGAAALDRALDAARLPAGH